MRNNRIIKIILDNNSTFYNYSSNERISIFKRISIFIIISIFLALVFTKSINDLISNAITVQSILLGFSFSVLFYIASNKEKIKDNYPSIEDKLNHKKMIKLSYEIFSNVSYYNLVAISSLALGLLIIFLNPPTENDSIKFILDFFTFCGLEKENLFQIKKIILLSLKALFYFFMIESGYTFLRIVGRIQYLFDEKD